MRADDTLINYIEFMQLSWYYHLQQMPDDWGIGNVQASSRIELKEDED